MGATEAIEVRPLTRQQIEQKAAEALALHGMNSVPIDVVALANALGIQVHNAKFSDDGLSAMLAKRGDAITLLINESRSSE